MSGRGGDEAERQPLLPRSLSNRGASAQYEAVDAREWNLAGATDSFDSKITAALKSSLGPVESWEMENRGLRFDILKRVAQLPDGHLSGVLTLLLVHFCSLFVHFSILGNLVLYLVGYVNMAQDMACIVSLLWVGVSYVLPLLGGWLADTRLGRQRAILVGLVLNCVAIGLLAVHAAIVRWSEAPTKNITNGTAIVNGSHWTLQAGGAIGNVALPEKGEYTLLVFGLLLATFGSTMLWPNVPVFGADQFLLWSAGALPLRSFFHWLFWMSNLAAVIVFTGVAYVQQYIDFVYGYLPAVIVLVITTVVYIRALYMKVYHVDPPDRQAFGEAIGIVGESLRHISKRQPTFRSERLKFTWLDVAKIVHGGSFSTQAVEDVKNVYRLLPLFAVLIIYWTIYSQVRNPRMKFVVTCTFWLESMAKLYCYTSKPPAKHVLSFFEGLGFELCARHTGANDHVMFLIMAMMSCCLMQTMMSCCLMWH